MDETSIFINWETANAARRSFAHKGSRSVQRKRGRNRMSITMYGVICASGFAFPPTLLWRTETVS